MRVIPRMRIEIRKIIQNNIFSNPPFLKIREFRYACTLMLPIPNW
jgi:hypothetical protein